MTYERLPETHVVALGERQIAEALIDAKLRALKALNDPKYRYPQELTAAFNARIDDALAAEQNQWLRSGLVNASLNILEDTGDYAKSYQVAKAEMARSGDISWPSTLDLPVYCTASIRVHWTTTSLKKSFPIS